KRKRLETLKGTACVRTCSFPAISRPGHHGGRPGVLLGRTHVGRRLDKLRPRALVAAGVGVGRSGRQLPVVHEVPPAAAAAVGAAVRRGAAVAVPPVALPDRVDHERDQPFHRSNNTKIHSPSFFFFLRLLFLRWIFSFEL
uniref:Uncharacterized protein n=1 Tax=Triticum urartu TaxID=4572 RepID=A0A8R7PCR7_TRIUA